MTRKISETPWLFRDFRKTYAYRSVAEVYDRLLRPHDSQPYAFGDLSTSGGSIDFSGSMLVDSFDANATTQWFTVKDSARAVPATSGARLIEYSKPGGFEARVFDNIDNSSSLQLIRGTQRSAEWTLPGELEHLTWSPSGDTLLIVTGASSITDGPAWLPSTQSRVDASQFRGLWIWYSEHDQPSGLSLDHLNPWEACWFGDQNCLVVAAEGTNEGGWFDAKIYCVDLQNGTCRLVHTPSRQVGGLSGSPSQHQAAWLEGTCSGRHGVIGTLTIYRGDGEAETLDTGSIDASHICWKSDDALVISGLRGAETVVAEIRPSTGETQEIWCSTTETISGWMATAACDERGVVSIITESYERSPAICSINTDGANEVFSGNRIETEDYGRIQPISWEAPDGLEIQGWLVTPPREFEKPAAGWPLLVDIHGGPVSAHRNRWSAGLRAAPAMAQQGWAILLPNPRGSAGRGQAFVEAVVGDMGGRDLLDITSGIDFLIAKRLVDASRVVVTGNSYGAFMCGLLIGESQRFSAAIPICPVANWTSQHFASHIGRFDEIFLNANAETPERDYIKRSPVFSLSNVTTPTLVMGGERDRDTPVTQATELYNAVYEAGAESALVVYPEDDHGLFGIPAYIDSAARTVDWALRHTVA